jgi:hypothetical protein
VCAHVAAVVVAVPLRQSALQSAVQLAPRLSIIAGVLRELLSIDINYSGRAT